MNLDEIKTFEQIKKFLDGTVDVEFSIGTKDERYAWIDKTLKQFTYLQCSKKQKSILLCFIEKISGYSRIQVKRLVRQYFETGSVKRLKPKKHRGFKRIYSNQDIRLLARTDELHNQLSGAATKKICQRALEIFDEQDYERLARISIAHIYNLRKSKAYRKVRQRFEKTKSKRCQIGDRRKPRPNGIPGYIRVDTVHQGDLDSEKGVYHINAVDEVTQFEIVCSVEKISEMFLIPVLEELIGQFPFVIKGFHSDNGSEYINRYVAKLLNKLLIELTKSRPRHSNDNALVESKNGSIVRKCLGYVHIPQEYAPQINQFLSKYLNSYINYHRPCFFALTVTNKRGKQIKCYPFELMMTPYEKLRSIADAEKYLKKGISFEKLDEIAKKMSDNESAKQLNEAREKLFNEIYEQETKQFRTAIG